MLSFFLLFDPKNRAEESKQHRNQAKFDLFCFQRFGNRFGGAEGAAPFKLFAPFCTFLHLSKKPEALFHRS